MPTASGGVQTWVSVSTSSDGDASPPLPPTTAVV